MQISGHLPLQVGVSRAGVTCGAVGRVCYLLGRNESLTPMAGVSKHARIAPLHFALLSRRAPTRVASFAGRSDDRPAPGSEDTELGVFMRPEVSHGKTKIYAGSSSLRLYG
jgi:hypothetical protein